MVGFLAFSTVLCDTFINTSLGYTMINVKNILLSKIQYLDLSTINQHVFVTKSDKNNNGVCTYFQVWNQLDASKFVEVIEIETNNLFEKKV